MPLRALAAAPPHFGQQPPPAVSAILSAHLSLLWACLHQRALARPAHPPLPFWPGVLETSKAMFSLPVSVSTLDMSAANLQAVLRSATKESLAAIAALLPLGSPQRLLLTPRNDIQAEDVVLSELLNQRGPAAWLAAPSSSGPAASDSSCSSAGSASSQETEGSSEAPGAALVRLAQRCIERREVLVLTTQMQHFDLLLLPRQAVAEDGVAFAVFATRVDGVRFIAQTIAAKQVAVVLDLDSTLLESEHLPVQPPEWRDLPWKAVPLRQEPSGQAVTGRVCQLPNEDHHAEGVHAASWVWKGAVHNYRVRQRLGWSHLRDLLVQECHPGGKLSAYVLSLGRPLYIQTCWQILDPKGLIIAQHEIKQKVNSARPDGVYWVPEKTPCIGLGLRSVFDPDFNMRLGPIWIADDLPEVFMAKYVDSVFAVPPYRPVANLPTDYDADGSVLRGMAVSIEQFWRHCYGADGSGGAVAAAAAAAQQVLHQLCCIPLDGVAPGEYCDQLFKGQEAVSSALSVRSFLERQQQHGTLELATESAVPAAPFVPENDENALALQSKPSSSTAALAAVHEARVLRPSSRQDLYPAQPTHLPGMPGKSGSGQPLAPAGAPEQAPADAPSLAAVSIVPKEGERSDDDSLHRLILLLASAAEQQGPGEVPPAAAPCKHASGGEEDEGVAIEGRTASSDGLEACPVELAAAGSTEVEDVEVAAALPAEGVGESEAAGRKRSFAAIAGQDSLLGPVAPTILVASASSE
ncbi:hypothetical protein ABPG75_003043 [Micractinium tetrahymenae]